jgi:hypothetical protein
LNYLDARLEKALVVLDVAVSIWGFLFKKIGSSDVEKRFRNCDLLLKILHTLLQIYDNSIHK